MSYDSIETSDKKSHIMWSYIVKLQTRGDTYKYVVNTWINTWTHSHRRTHAQLQSISYDFSSINDYIDSHKQPHRHSSVWIYERNSRTHAHFNGLFLLPQSVYGTHICVDICSKPRYFKRTLFSKCQSVFEFLRLNCILLLLLLASTIRLRHIVTRTFPNWFLIFMSQRIVSQSLFVTHFNHFIWNFNHF